MNTQPRKLTVNCPVDFKPMIIGKYVDCIFVPFSSKGYFKRFVNYINKKNICVKFTSENENDSSFSFLDIKITPHN